MPVADQRSRQRFWTRYQPGFRFTNEEIGTRAFFDAVEQHRYSLEPAIREKINFPQWQGLDVLEAGCGIATDGINFARHGARYTGVDFSDSAIELARHRFQIEDMPGRIIRGSITDLPVANESQDLVYSNGVIHHIPDTQRSIDEFYRVLRPGGKAIVMVYHRDSFNYRVNIMLVRRTLAFVVLIPGMPSLVARITGEEHDVIGGHRALFRKHGTSYLTDRALFLSNNTDGPGNPLSKVMTRAHAHRMFRAFHEVRTDTRLLGLRLYPGGNTLAKTGAARHLERRYGWHLWITATKLASGRR